LFGGQKQLVILEALLVRSPVGVVLAEPRLDGEDRSPVERQERGSPELSAPDQPGLLEHPDVLVDGRQGQPAAGRKPADRPWLETEQVHHLAPMAVGEGPEEPIQVVGNLDHCATPQIVN